MTAERSPGSSFWVGCSQEFFLKGLALKGFFLLRAAEGVQDIHKGALQCTESRMLRRQAAWKAHPPLFDGLDQLHLGRVTGIKTQGIRRKDHGIFIAACGFRDDAVQFPGLMK